MNARAVSLLSGLAAPSQYMLDKHNKYGIRCSYQKAISNAVDIDVYRPAIENIKNKENIILYAGDIREEKGLNTLIKVVEGLSDVTLYLIGQGPLAEHIEQTDTVKLIPWMRQIELYRLMRKSKIVVLPSEWEEAFGRILIEGIANGTISVGSNRGGIPEVLNFDEEFIFEAGNVASMKKCLNSILNFSFEGYKEHLDRQQSWMGKYSREYYCDEWEKFFLHQIGE